MVAHLQETLSRKYPLTPYQRNTFHPWCIGPSDSFFTAYLLGVPINGVGGCAQQKDTVASSRPATTQNNTSRYFNFNRQYKITFSCVVLKVLAR